MTTFFTKAGAILALLSVALGAFGAHGLAPHFAANPTLEPTFKTAVQYHQFGALGLFVIAWALTRWQQRQIVWAGWLILIGTLFFSGSLYILSIFNIRIMGAIAPIGGTAQIIGWLLLAWHAKDTASHKSI